MGWVEIAKTITYGEAEKAFGEIEVKRTWYALHSFPNSKEYDPNEPYPYKVQMVLGDSYRDHKRETAEDIEAAKLDSMGHRL